MKSRAIKPKGRRAARLRRRKRQLLARVRLPPEALPGSLAETHRRCGKASCHCATGKGHPVWSLTFVFRGRKQVERIPEGWVEEARQQVESGRKFKWWVKSSRSTPNCWPWDGSNSIVEASWEAPLGGWWRGPPAGRTRIAKGEDGHGPTASAAHPRRSSGSPPPVRPHLAEQVPRLMVLEREVEDEFRPRLLEALQRRVDALAARISERAPNCPRCQSPLHYHDSPRISWLTRFGRMRVRASRYRGPACQQEHRPQLELLGVEPGRISGSLARLVALLGVVVPYELAARLVWLFFGVPSQSHGGLARRAAVGGSRGPLPGGLESVLR